MSKPIVTVRLWGGLCNRFFQIAAIMGYSEKHNCEYKLYEKLMDDNSHTESLETLNILKTIFPELIIDKNSDIKESDFNMCIEIDGNDATNYIELQSPISNTSAILLKGYFQSEKYFPKNTIFLDKFENNMRFTIDKQNKSIDSNDKNHINDTTYINLQDRFDFTNTYFIHIRMGDYIGHYLLYLGYKTYLFNAIKHILTLHPEAIFLICSNEINKEKIKTEMGEIYELCNITNNKFYFESDLNINLEPLTTLYNMSMCNGGICLNSSFSWIGAYLCHIKNNTNNNNKNIVYSPKCIIMPNKWFNESYIPYSRYKDIYPFWEELNIISLEN